MISLRRARVGILHPRLGAGGSEARALWAVDALKDDYDVTLITAALVELDRLNEYYGTRLDPQDFCLRQIPLPPGLARTARLAALRGALIQRACQRLAPDFDLMVSAYNPCDFGRPAIQCLADFSFVEELRPELHPVLRDWKSWLYSDSLVRRAYLGLCRRLSPARPEAWKKNLTLANSHWSARLLRERYGIEARVLYPPVAGDFPVVPFAERENGFVCIGRLVPEKRMDAVIAILAEVRRRGHDVHLHLVGPADDSRYARTLEALGRQHRDWVFLEGPLVGTRKKDLMARHRYAISACAGEAFGIAVAELVKAGGIVFVPASGGQTEIVNHPALIYENEADAVRRIVAVLENPAQQQALRDHLACGAARFSVENFQRGLREAVAQFLRECAGFQRLGLASSVPHEITTAVR